MGLFDDKKINEIVKKINEHSEEIESLTSRASENWKNNINTDQKLNLVIIVLVIYFLYRITRKFTIKKR